MDEDLSKRILDANIALHDVEAQFYDIAQPEIFNRVEQARIASAVITADSYVVDNKKRALDFGAGTGNLTGKLVDLGYRVTAVDISMNMVNVLETKFASHLADRTLVTIVGGIESIESLAGQCDLVACCSVLHHLPDYPDAIRRLGYCTKKGGVMLLDHEASEARWNRTRLEKLLYYATNRSSGVLNRLYWRWVLGKTRIPRQDFSLGDYWTTSEHHIDHELIRRVFQEMNFEFATPMEYHVNLCVWFNPFFHIYKAFCRPDGKTWIARK